MVVKLGRLFFLASNRIRSNGWRVERRSLQIAHNFSFPRISSLKKSASSSIAARRMQNFETSAQFLVERPSLRTTMRVPTNFARRRDIQPISTFSATAVRQSPSSSASAIQRCRWGT
jgi:hypothetical protein